MAETAESLITDALGGIFAVAAEQPTDQNDINTGIRFLNRMMAEFDVRGISLGYTNVSSPSDAITVADGAITGMIANLSLRLAPVYGEPVSGELAASARDGLNAMRKLGVVIFPTQRPCTLPVGSGNEGDSFDNDHFYTCPDEEVLNEQGGSIILEDNT